MKECPESPDGKHVMARRRDGKACAYCGAWTFGTSELSLSERERIRRTKAHALMLAAQKEPTK